MIRLLGVVPVVLATTGCMSLDFAILGGDPVDAYDLSGTIVPAEQIEIVHYPSADGTDLSGVWFHQREAAPPLIWFHGNGGNATSYLGRTDVYWGWGYDVFVPDYRGYGETESEVSSAIVHDDGVAAVHHVEDKLGVTSDQIPMLGLSLGASVLVHTMAQLPAQSATIEDLFLSAGAVGDDGTGLDLPTGWFFADPYANDEVIRDAQAPVFVIHGTGDTYVNPEYSQVLYDNAPEPKQLWNPEGAEHADAAEAYPEEYAERVRGWIDEFAAPE